eukprot:66918-Amorphochlora_amoeboformis.AAC.1
MERIGLSRAIGGPDGGGGLVSIFLQPGVAFISKSRHWRESWLQRRLRGLHESRDQRGSPGEGDRASQLVSSG